MLGTVGTEEKTGKMSRACVELTAQTTVTHIIGAHLKNLRQT